MHALGLSAVKVTPDPVLIASEAALWGAIHHQGLLPDTVIVSDDAGQFRVGAHALCWIHAERLAHKLVPANDKQRNAIEIAKRMIWWFYRALKEYKLAPRAEQAQLLRARFDRIFKRASTGYVTLDRLLRRLFQNKDGLLRVLERPEIPINTNASENDIRAFVTKRKISGGTVSEKGRDARDTMLGLAKTCMKLKLSFYDFVGDCLGVPGLKIPLLSSLIRQAPTQTTRRSPGNLPRLRRLRQSNNVGQDIDDQPHDRRDEEERENRVQKRDAADRRRGDRHIGGLITHGDGKRIIHEIPVIRRLPLRVGHPLVIMRRIIGNRVIVVHPHIMQTEPDMRQQPGEDDRRQRGAECSMRTGREQVSGCCKAPTGVMLTSDKRITPARMRMSLGSEWLDSSAACSGAPSSSARRTSPHRRSRRGRSRWSARLRLAGAPSRGRRDRRRGGSSTICRGCAAPKG